MFQVPTYQLLKYVYYLANILVFSHLSNQCDIKSFSRSNKKPFYVKNTIFIYVQLKSKVITHISHTTKRRFYFKHISNMFVIDDLHIAKMLHLFCVSFMLLLETTALRRRMTCPSLFFTRNYSTLYQQRTRSAFSYIS